MQRSPVSDGGMRILPPTTAPNGAPESGGRRSPDGAPGDVAARRVGQAWLGLPAAVALGWHQAARGWLPGELWSVAWLAGRDGRRQAVVRRRRTWWGRGAEPGFRAIIWTGWQR